MLSMFHFENFSFDDCWFGTFLQCFDSSRLQIEFLFVGLACLIRPMKRGAAIPIIAIGIRIFLFILPSNGPWVPIYRRVPIYLHFSLVVNLYRFCCCCA